jgi:hypothetical protein
MEESIRVRMTENMLYDFMLFHTYSKFSGFLINVLGLAVVFMGIILFATGRHSGLYLGYYIAAGLVFLGYTPLLIKFRARRQLRYNPKYRDIFFLTFGEDGIKATQNEKVSIYEWSRIKKVVVAPKTIGYYYDVNDAIIVPKEAYEGRFSAVMQIVFKHVPRGTVKIHN